LSESIRIEKAQKGPTGCQIRVAVMDREEEEEEEEDA
jgi:hypothetical protein